MRLRCRCWFLGCQTDGYPACHYCGADLYCPYRGRFLETGWWWELVGRVLVALDRLARWRDAVVGRLLGRRCRQCGRRFRGPSVARWADLCSDQCSDKIIPF